MKLIVRSAYLEEMATLALTPDIKVITGVRRSGKSKLMEAFSEQLKQADAGANIIHINFNQTEFEDLLEYHALEQYIESRYHESFPAWPQWHRLRQAAHCYVLHR